jgi:membrane-associated phospholipid phosphatase
MGLADAVKGQTSHMRAGLPAFIRRRLDPEARFGLRVTLLAVALLIVAVPFGLLLEQVVRLGPVDRADKAVASDLHVVACERPLLVSVMRVVSALGTFPWIHLFVAITVGWLLVRRERRLAIFVAATTISGGLLNGAVKTLVDRPRPSLEGCLLGTARGMSFPSGHAMGTTICYGTLLLVGITFVRPRGRQALIAVYGGWVALMALSRMTLGVHYLSDVLGGIALGAAWLAAGTAAFEIWRRERGRPMTGPLDEGLEPEVRHANANPPRHAAGVARPERR